MRGKPHILLIFIALLLFAGGFRFFHGEPTLQDNLDSVASHWPKLKLLLDPAAAEFRVVEWDKPHLDMQAKAMSNIQATKVLPVLIRELQKYPASVINNNVDAIAVVDSLMLSTVYQNSVHSGRRIYLSAKVLANANNVYHLHRELNRVLLRSNHFPLMQWGKTMPGYENHNSVLASLSEENADSCDLPKTAQEKLRMVGLDLSVVENDIAELSGQMFSTPHALKASIQKDNILNRKYEMLVNFYADLEPGYAWKF